MSRITEWIFSNSLFRSYKLYADHDGQMLADSVTYRALFSVFASVLLGFSAVGLWFGGNPQAIHALSTALNEVIPGMSEVIDGGALEQPVGFTLAGLISLGGLVFAATGAAKSLRAALHQISDNEFQTTPVVQVFLRDLGVAVGLGLLVGLAAIASFATSIGLGNIAELLGLSTSGAVFNLLGRTAGLLVIFGIDVLAIALVFTLLSGMVAPKHLLWKGAALGGAGLLILQEFSGLFVAGATSNPLLASFAALIVLLLWFNLSSQVILISSTWIILETWRSEGDIRSLDDAKNMDDWKVMAAKAKVESAKLELARTEKNVAAAKAKKAKAAADIKTRVERLEDHHEKHHEKRQEEVEAKKETKAADKES